MSIALLDGFGLVCRLDLLVAYACTLLSYIGGLALYILQESGQTSGRWMVFALICLSVELIIEIEKPFHS
jgi:hypothetical protein